jgi:hypothetical protein
VFFFYPTAASGTAVTIHVPRISPDGSTDTLSGNRAA